MLHLTIFSDDLPLINNHIIVYLILLTYNFSYFTTQILFYIYFSQSIISSVNQGDGFVEVTLESKKRKASNSPMLPSQSKPGSSEPPPGTTIYQKPRQKPYRKTQFSHNQWCRRKLQILEETIGQNLGGNYRAN